MPSSRHVLLHSKSIRGYTYIRGRLGGVAEVTKFKCTCIGKVILSLSLMSRELSLCVHRKFYAVNCKDSRLIVLFSSPSEDHKT